MKSFAAVPWSKSSRIVVALDLGTTHTAVSFAFLFEGAPQCIHRVSSWPGQEAQKGESKIPSVLWYDRDGKAVSFGAEALSPQAEEEAEDQHWQLAKHFKLHLHPESMKTQYKIKLDPIPSGVSLDQIYTDFLRYLLAHTRSFFESRVLDGRAVWAKYCGDMEIILAHPNGWGFAEQSFLRRAATNAGYAADDKDARKRVRFVSEAEASVHFCMFHGNLDSRLKPGATFAVCDAGGSTVDITVYNVSDTEPALRLQETKASACSQSGAVFVDAAAEAFLRKRLSDPDVGLETEVINDYVRKGLNEFESGAKKAFRDIGTDQSIEVGGVRWNNATLNVRRGRMTLAGSVIKSFFQPCVDQIVASLKEQIAGQKVEHILLVGGFGDSPFLQKSLIAEFGSLGCEVTVANDLAAKAVSDGAVIWHAKLSVTARATRFAYGVKRSTPYDPTNPDHIGRAIRASPDGDARVSGLWSPLINRGTSVDTNFATRKFYSWRFDNATPRLNRFPVMIYAYTPEKGLPPAFMFDKQDHLHGGFEEACVVSANLSGLSGALVKEAKNGVECWRLDCKIALCFGGIELQGFLEWEQDGKTHTGPITVLPRGVLFDSK